MCHHHNTVYILVLLNPAILVLDDRFRECSSLRLDPAHAHICSCQMAHKHMRRCQMTHKQGSCPFICAVSSSCVALTRSETMLEGHLILIRILTLTPKKTGTSIGWQRQNGNSNDHDCSAERVTSVESAGVPPLADRHSRGVRVPSGGGVAHSRVFPLGGALRPRPLTRLHSHRRLALLV